MNIYKVGIVRGSSIDDFRVVAKDMTKVIELVEKHAKKNYWYSYRIDCIQFHTKADLVQK